MKIFDRRGRELQGMEIMIGSEPLPWFLIPAPDGRLFRLISEDYHERPTLDGDSPQSPSRWVRLEVSSRLEIARHRRSTPNPEVFHWETRDGKIILDNGEGGVYRWSDDDSL